MVRPLTVFLPLPGDREIEALLLARPEEWLPEGSRSAGPITWWVPLHGVGLRRSVACRIDDAWRTGHGTWRALSWDPAPEEGDIAPMERLLPSFSGELGIARIGGGSPSLVLTGSYQVPAGPMGELADAMLLHRIAQRTGTVFLVEVSARLRQAHPVSA